MLFLAMLLVVALLPFVIVFQLTSLAHSVYRNRLWLLRDRIADDLRRGSISRSTTAKEIKSLVDDQIQVAGRHTLADSFLAIKIYDVEGRTSVFEEILKEGTPMADREVLISYLTDFRSATLNHLMWGSVFGWIFTAVFSLAEAFLKVGRWHAARTGNPAGRTQGNAQSAHKTLQNPSHSTRRSRGRGKRAYRSRNSVEKRAQQIRQMVERAEVEIMPSATPSRHAKDAASAAVMVGR